MITAEQWVLNGESSEANIVSEDAGAAESVRARRFRVGGYSDKASLVEGVLSDIEGRRDVRRYSWGPSVGFICGECLTVEPSERGPRANEPVRGVVLRALEIFPGSQGESVACSEYGLLQSSFGGVIVGPIDVVEWPYDEWDCERDTSFSAEDVVLGMIAHQGMEDGSVPWSPRWLSDVPKAFVLEVF
jgi:hypothetical protein